MIVIDGHNLLWAVHEMTGGSGISGEVALCHMISRYLKLASDVGLIVFDGTGPSDKSGFDNISNLEVLFSGLSTDADSVIESKVRANGMARGMTVVSSDRQLRRVSQTKKAAVVKAEEFWRTMQTELGRKKVDEPSAKRHGLSESETDRWLELFGFEQ